MNGFINPGPLLELRLACAREFEMQAAREANRLIFEFFYALKLLCLRPENPFRDATEWELHVGGWPFLILRQGLGSN